MNCNTWENITKRWIVKSGVRGCLSAIYCKIVVFAHIRGGIYLLNLPPVEKWMVGHYLPPLIWFSATLRGGGKMDNKRHMVKLPLGQMVIRYPHLDG